jgi:lantibiotic modifying enzyme
LLSLKGNGCVDADAAWFNEIANHIIAGGSDGPLCLCRGALGHLEFIDVLAERGRLRDAAGAATWRRQILARLISGDWVADEAHCLESPGLLLGLAGTGYSLLRAAARGAVPSVLTLT